MDPAERNCKAELPLVQPQTEETFRILAVDELDRQLTRALGNFVEGDEQVFELAWEWLPANQLHTAKCACRQLMSGRTHTLLAFRRVGSAGWAFLYNFSAPEDSSMSA